MWLDELTPEFPTLKRDPSPEYPSSSNHQHLQDHDQSRSLHLPHLGCAFPEYSSHLTDKQPSSRPAKHHHMWDPIWRPSQGSPPTTRKFQANDQASGLSKQLSMSAGSRGVGNHQARSTSPSSNDQIASPRSSTAMATADKKSPKHAPLSKSLQQPKAEGRLQATGDDISDLISGIAAKTHGDELPGSNATGKPPSTQSQTRSTPITAPSQDSAEEQASRRTNAQATQPLPARPPFVPPPKKRVSTVQGGSVQHANPKTPSPCHNVNKQQSGESPEEGEVTGNTPVQLGSTNHDEQYVEENKSSVLRPGPKVNQECSNSMTAKGGPSGRLSSTQGDVLQPENSDTHNVLGPCDNRPSASQHRTKSMAPIPSEPKGAEELQHRRASQGTDAVENIKVGSSERLLQNKLSCAPSVQAQTSNTGHKSTVLAQRTLQDKDLSDWLEFTGYHNVEYRARYLNRQRRLVELDRIRAELKEEDERDRPQLAPFSQGSTMTLPKPTPPSITTQGLEATNSGSNTLMSSTTNDLSTSSEDTHNFQGVSVLKRGRFDDDGQELHPGKFARIDCGSSGRQEIVQEIDDTQEAKHSQRVSRQPMSPQVLPTAQLQYSSHVQEHRRSASPPLHRPISSSSNNWRKSGTFAQDRYSESIRDDDRLSPSTSHQRYKDFSDVRHRKLDLGLPGESRFFIVKSYSPQNVEACKRDGLWLTQTQNIETLTSAFAKCKNVILIFSVNKSKRFQGYARMVTGPSSHTPSPRWQKNLNFDTSPPFRVEWICTTEIHFSVVHYLTNSLNEGEDKSIIVAKDTHEVEDTCARELLELMDEGEANQSRWRSTYEREERDWDEGRLTPPFYSSSFRGSARGRGGRGGHGSPRGRGRPYFKHEWS